MNAGNRYNWHQPQRRVLPPGHYYYHDPRYNTYRIYPLYSEDTFNNNFGDETKTLEWVRSELLFDTAKTQKIENSAQTDNIDDIKINQLSQELNEKNETVRGYGVFSS